MMSRISAGIAVNHFATLGKGAKEQPKPVAFTGGNEDRFVKAVETQNVLLKEISGKLNKLDDIEKNTDKLNKSVPDNSKAMRQMSDSMEKLRSSINCSKFSSNSLF